MLASGGVGVWDGICACATCGGKNDGGMTAGGGRLGLGAAMVAAAAAAPGPAIPERCCFMSRVNKQCTIVAKGSFDAPLAILHSLDPT